MICLIIVMICLIIVMICLIIVMIMAMICVINVMICIPRRRNTISKFGESGLSDLIEIESYSVIESNVSAQIESNRMHIESNVFFDFRYWFNSIWGRFWNQKSKTMTVKSENCTENDHKLFCQLFLTSWCIPPWRLTNLMIAIIYFSAMKQGFLSNRIEIESKGFCTFWI